MTSHGRKYHAVREVQSAGLLRGPGLDLSQTRAKILNHPAVIHKPPSFSLLFLPIDASENVPYGASSTTSSRIIRGNRDGETYRPENTELFSLSVREVGRQISPTLWGPHLGRIAVGPGIRQWRIAHDFARINVLSRAKNVSWRRVSLYERRTPDVTARPRFKRGGGERGGGLESVANALRVVHRRIIIHPLGERAKGEESQTERKIERGRKRR